MTAGSPADVARAAAAVAARLSPGGGDARSPSIAIVLGSGLGALADRIADPVRIPYGQIPGFHVPTVPGHHGELVGGTLGGQLVICQSGRFHMYEGHTAAESALPVRVFAALGVKTLIVTNAAGGVNRAFGPGTIMLISDHLNLTGRSPLDGPARPGEARFPDLTVAYDAELRRIARRVAAGGKLALAEGVYAGLLGPSYETPAEVTMLERLGADAVGMSTVMEVIVARALGIRCLGLSTVTNAAAGIGGANLSHAEVMEVAGKTGVAVGWLVEGIVAACQG